MGPARDRVRATHRGGGRRPARRRRPLPRPARRASPSRPRCAASAARSAPAACCASSPRSTSSSSTDGRTKCAPSAPRAHAARALGGLPVVHSGVRGRTSIARRVDSTSSLSQDVLNGKSNGEACAQSAPAPAGRSRDPRADGRSDGHPHRPHGDRAPAAVGPVGDHRGARGRRAAPDRPRQGRGRVRLRLRAPRRPAPQVGRGLHHPPGRRGEDLRRHAPGHRDAVRRAAARHGRGHVARPSRRSPSSSARRSPASSTASRSSPASRSSRATRRRPRTTAR